MQDNRVYDLIDEVEAQATKKEGNLITLSSGVVLKVRPVPPMILAKIDQKFPDPPMPMVRDEDRGRDIPNPQDPNYLNAVERNSNDKGSAIIDVLAGLGTLPVSVPEGMYTYDQDDWIEPLEFVGIEVPIKGTGRYLAWLKYYVIRSGEDLALIAKRSAKSLGVPEEAVADAIAGFQDQQERRTDSGSNA